MFMYPSMIWVAVLVTVALGFGYRALHRRRVAALAAAGVAENATGRWARWRRHVPPVLFLLALATLLVGVGRPQATVELPRRAGTVILAFDVSNSMMATDVKPSRLAVAQSAAIDFVRSQPSSVDIGIVSFEQGALTSLAPTADHEEAVRAINRMHTAGRTSVGSAILASLSAIVGQPVALPGPDSDAPAPDLGYWGSATIVLLSDGEDTGGPDPISAAELAGAAGVRVETIGIGTAEGAIIEVDGYQVATALDEQLLTDVAAATGGSYHPATDAETISDVYQQLEFRITSKPEELELTGAFVAAALVLLTAGGVLMTLWYGRIL
jgi:Ca-activated chloride channel family protein